MTFQTRYLGLISIFQKPCSTFAYHQNSYATFQPKTGVNIKVGDIDRNVRKQQFLLLVLCEIRYKKYPFGPLYVCPSTQRPPTILVFNSLSGTKRPQAYYMSLSPRKTCSLKTIICHFTCSCFQLLEIFEL